MPAIEFAQSALLEIAGHGIAVPFGHKESGARPLRGGQVNSEMAAAPATAVLQQFPNPVGVLEDPTPGQALIEQR